MALRKQKTNNAPPAAFGPTATPQGGPAAAPGTGVTAGAGLGGFGTTPVGSEFGTFLGDMFRFPGGVQQKLGQAAGPALDTGLGTLQQILQSQGRTDPAAFNRDLTQLSFGNQSLERGLQGNLAASGLGGSIGGKALQAATAGAGQERLADRRSKETQLAEARKRQDLGLLMEMITNPSLTSAGIRLGIPSGSSGSSSAAGVGALGSLLGGIGSILK